MESDVNISRRTFGVLVGATAATAILPAIVPAPLNKYEETRNRYNALIKYSTMVVEQVPATMNWKAHTRRTRLATEESAKIAAKDLFEYLNDNYNILPTSKDNFHAILYRKEDFKTKEFNKNEFNIDEIKHWGEYDDGIIPIMIIKELNQTKRFRLNSNDPLYGLKYLNLLKKYMVIIQRPDGIVRT